MKYKLWKEQYPLAMHVAQDLYFHALISEDIDEIEDYEMAIIKILINCKVRVDHTWKNRLEILESIRKDTNYHSNMDRRINFYMSLFKKYKTKHKKIYDRLHA